MSSSRQLHPENTTPRGDWIWVFASDNSGRHSKGYAKIAKVNFGAVYGQASGVAGRSYAIPLFTRSGLLPTTEVLSAIGEFCEYAQARPKSNFFVARMTGDELSVEDEAQIAQAFSSAPLNCSLPEAWSLYLSELKTFSQEPA